MLTFADLQSEVARRATKDQSGNQFTEAIKNAINSSLFRIARESPWRVLRRTAKFATVSSYTTGTGAVTVTLGSANVTVVGATFITDGVKINRKIKIGGYGTFYRIEKITGETTLVLDSVYGGASSTTETYEILPQEEYNLPPQCSHRMFMWHEAYGYPFKMTFVTDQDFFRTGLYLTIKYIPTHYRMWGENEAINQPLQPGLISVASSNSSDVNIPITIFGTVNGYPDTEVIQTNGANVTAGLKSFSFVERVTKSATSIGVITISSDSSQNIVAVIPTGDTTAGILYAKVQLYPLPTTAFNMNVWYYKDPYRLVNEGDTHELGQEFDEAIILLATSKIKAESNLTEGGTFYELWQDEMRSLKKHNTDKMDFFAVLRRPGSQGPMDAFLSPNLRFSQAGAYFGPSSRS